MHVKIPTITKYRSINAFLYLVIISAISCLITDCMCFANAFIYIWIIFLLSFAVIYYYVIPITLLIISVEYILVKCKCIAPTVVTATSTIKKTILVLSFISVLYLLWFIFYVSPNLE